MKIYHIYHLPHFVHKDGRVGKIGVSVEPIRRTKMQGFTEYEILEEFTCIYLVSYREIALQKEYGYKVDNSLYYETISAQTKESKSKGGKNASTKNWQTNRERELEKSAKGGKVIAEKYRRTTLMCDMNDNILKTFSNRKDAAKYVDGFASCITGAINISNRTYKGYKWKNSTSV